MSRRANFTQCFNKQPPPQPKSLQLVKIPLQDPSGQELSSFKHPGPSPDCPGRGELSSFKPVPVPGGSRKSSTLGRKSSRERDRGSRPSSGSGRCSAEPFEYFAPHRQSENEFKLVRRS